MNGERLFLRWALGFLVLLYVVGYLIGDQYYLLRIVQTANLDGLYILVGVVAGITLKEGAYEHSISLVFCVTALVICGFLSSGLPIPQDASLPWPRRFLLTFLAAAFVTALIGCFLFIFLSLRTHHRQAQQQAETVEKKVREQALAAERAVLIRQATPPKFVRTKPPRFH
ncbi:hypothetical protein SAMN05661010_00065 [Modicisalibacter muralis]|uniref:Transmembrane protein n=1 Tax=Modicisalibacter muralis TaxID=119000 RepID=A0A1G9EPV4_9GAMM|nr:hypothetical protein [Halomonas muralis]SDK78237.1 hypothetical protein SAMN05661010_00065 [Halomonas muralis]